MYKLAEQENKHKLFTYLLLIGVVISSLTTLSVMSVYTYFNYPTKKIIFSALFPIFMFPFSYYVYLISKRDKTIKGLKTYLTGTSLLISLAVFLFGGALSASTNLFIWIIIVSGILLKPKYALYSSIIFASYIMILFTLQYFGIYTPLFDNPDRIKLILNILYGVIVMIFAVGYLTYLNTIFLNKSRNELEYYASHDPLTSLLNMFTFKAKLIQTIEKNKKNKNKNKNKIALLFIDLDNFKDINDRLGHEAGDELLIEVSLKLKMKIGNKYKIARFGGDVFVLSIEYNYSLDKLKEVISKEILTIFNIPYIVKEHEFQISASIGASTYPESSSSAQELISNSYIALYKAKQKGKNRTEFYTLNLKNKITQKIDIKNKLRKAIKNNKLVLYYQAQTSLETNKIIGAEALVRWKTKDKIIYPNEFISIAEESGIIVELGEFTLRKACKDLKEWHDNGKKINISVNISSQQFQLPDIVEKIKTIIKETGADPSYLELEITETDLMAQEDGIIKKISMLRKIGIKISIDDFGTGYSSLAYLKNFDISKVKIDKSFIWKLEENKEDKPIIQAIITISKALNLEVIAEGVETQYQKDFLTENNCDYFQGYLCSRPIPKDEFNKLISKKGIL